MALNVIWTNFAKDQLAAIFDYYKVKANPKTAKNLVTKIIDETNLLKFQADIGPKEELLLDRPENFRYLVYKKYKIIYWLNEKKNRIEITDIFDTRRNPNKINRFK